MLSSLSFNVVSMYYFTKGWHIRRILLSLIAAAQEATFWSYDSHLFLAYPDCKLVVR